MVRKSTAKRRKMRIKKSRRYEGEQEEHAYEKKGRSVKGEMEHCIRAQDGGGGG